MAFPTRQQQRQPLLLAAVAAVLCLTIAITTQTVAIGVEAVAQAQCWFNGTTISGSFLLYQDTASSTVSADGFIMSVPAGLTYQFHLRNYGDLLDAATNLGGCLAEDAPFSVSPTISWETFAGTSSAMTLFGATSVVGRAFAVYSASGNCSSLLNIEPLATCVIGIKNDGGASWLTNEAVQSVGSVVTASAPLFDPASQLIGWTHFANNIATTGATFPEVVVSIKVWGLVANSVHSVHVHWFGDMTTSDGLSAGGHLNPDGRNHGTAPSLQRHAGDIGTVTADMYGNITFVGSFNKLTLNGYGNIIGRAVVLHALGDDGNPDNTTTSTGAAGARIARGVIGISARRPTNLNPAYATCTFTPGQAITGQLLLQQLYTSGDTRITGSLTSVTASGTMNLFVNTYGDIASTSYGGDCWNNRSAPMASWTATVGSVSTLDAYVLLNTIALFGDNKDNAIIGRVLTVSTASTCADASSAVTAQCVVGIASASAALNPAVQSLITNPVGAHCQLTAGSAAPSNFAGEVHFSPSSITDEVYVYLYARGLVAGSVHSIHVHQYGDLLLADGTSAGGHLNPLGKNHGWAPSTERHRGDIGNFTADSNGIIQEGRSFNLLNFMGASNIIGRGCIFHALRDDGNPLNTTDSVGAAGARWGRGVIGISSRSAPIAPFPASSSAMSYSSSSSGGTAGHMSSSGSHVSAASTSTAPAAVLLAAVLAAAAAALL